MPFFKSEVRTEEELLLLHKDWAGEIPFETWLSLRDRCRKDLFFLGKDILKKDLVERTHRPVCDFFVKKNFDGLYPENYTLGDVHRAIDKQDPDKDRLLNDPRGAFKSTLRGIDIVQWMLNVPDIRILKLTGEYKLAVAFLTEIKGYFYLPEDAEPSDFQRLFPEYILRGRDGDSEQPFVCPARKIKQKEPTVWANSITSNLAGWHCDIEDLDDIVTDENSETKDRREKLKEKADNVLNLLDEWGYRFLTGTRYFSDDYYGTRLESASEDNPLKVLVRAAWTPKPGKEKQAQDDIYSLTEDDVDLLFPEKLTFKSLRKKLLNNERLFRCQQLNQSVESFDCTFTEDALRKATVLYAAVPTKGRIINLWDTASSVKKGSDYTVGAAILIDEQFRVFVLEVVVGKFKPSEKAQQIVSLAKRWGPETAIENANGADNLQPEITRLALTQHVEIKIQWLTVENSEGAKKERVRGLETLLAAFRLFFVANCMSKNPAHLSDIGYLYERFTKFTGERGRKDDIPDCISRAQLFLPKTTTRRELTDEEKKEAALVARQDLFYKMMFPEPSEAPIEEPVAVATHNGLPDIFGGNGLRG